MSPNPTAEGDDADDDADAAAAGNDNDDDEDTVIRCVAGRDAEEVTDRASFSVPRGIVWTCVETCGDGAGGKAPPSGRRRSAGG